MFKKDFIRVKIDLLKVLKGQRKGIFDVKVLFPKDMPKEEIEDIKQRLNKILDDIKKYI